MPVVVVPVVPPPVVGVPVVVVPVVPVPVVPAPVVPAPVVPVPFVPVSFVPVSFVPAPVLAFVLEELLETLAVLEGVLLAGVVLAGLEEESVVESDEGVSEETELTGMDESDTDERLAELLITRAMSALFSASATLETATNATMATARAQPPDTMIVRPFRESHAFLMESRMF